MRDGLGVAQSARVRSFVVLTVVIAATMTTSRARAEPRVATGVGASFALDGGMVSSTLDVHLGVRVAGRWWANLRVGHGNFGPMDPAGQTFVDRSATEVRGGPTWMRCADHGCWGTSFELGVHRGYLHQIDALATPQEWETYRTTAVSDARVRGQLHIAPNGYLSLEASAGLRYSLVIEDRNDPPSWYGGDEGEARPGFALGAALVGRL